MLIYARVPIISSFFQVMTKKIVKYGQNQPTHVLFLQADKSKKIQEDTRNKIQYLLFVLPAWSSPSEWRWWSMQDMFWSEGVDVGILLHDGKKHTHEWQTIGKDTQYSFAQTAEQIKTLLQALLEQRQISSYDEVLISTTSMWLIPVTHVVKGLGKDQWLPYIAVGAPISHLNQTLQTSLEMLLTKHGKRWTTPRWKQFFNTVSRWWAGIPLIRKYFAVEYAEKFTVTIGDAFAQEFTDKYRSTLGIKDLIECYESATSTHQLFIYGNKWDWFLSPEDQEKLTWSDFYRTFIPKQWDRLQHEFSYKAEKEALQKTLARFWSINKRTD